MLDYDELEKIATENKPDLIVAGFTAYSQVIDFYRFRQIADKVEAKLMIDMSHFAGLVAGCAYPSPFSFADIVTSTTHKTLRGPRGALIFSKGEELAKIVDKTIIPGFQGGPHNNNIAAIAQCLFEADSHEFRVYAHTVCWNAIYFAEELQSLGWNIISNGTQSHLFLVDVFNSVGISGKEAEKVLEKNGIIVNRNTIPFDSRSPFDPSGIRIGTAAITTLGYDEQKVRKLAQKISKILKTYASCNKILQK
jgi:glycine hydroxymethyltransferase